MIYLPFVLLLIAVLGLWVHRNVALAALGLSVVAACFTGALEHMAVVWIVLLGALAAWCGTRGTAGRRPGSAPKARSGPIPIIAFGVMAVAMALLVFPGFPRTVVVENVVLSPGALPYTLGLGFAKVVPGIFIMAFLHPERVRSWRELGQVLTRVAPVLLVTALVVMALTLALGYVEVDAKWTPLFFAWALANLFFTCLSEEAFFRGFLQRELARIGGNRRIAGMLAIAVGALLFGLVHLGGGWKYALAATLAGVGYGIAYHRTQRVEGAMAVHFGLNALHFLCFTYPALAPA